MAHFNNYIYVSLLLLVTMIFTEDGLISKAAAGVAPPSETLIIPIQISSDDAEENSSNGDISLSSSDLEMVLDGVKLQKVGLRFPLEVPVGATILNASIQFTVDETGSDATNLIVHGQAIANALTFSNTDFDISSRTLTSASVPWATAAWNTKGEAGVDQQTPDLSTIVQEVINQGGWAQGNNIAIIISGTGKRVAESFNGTAAPVLHLEFSALPLADDAPVAVDDDTFAAPAYTTGIDQKLTVLNGTDDIVERNDSAGIPVAEVSSFGPESGAETVVGGSGSSIEGGTVVVAADGSFTYTPPTGFLGVDSFVYTLENTEGTSTAIVYISVEEVEDLTTLWIPVITGSDDAEQKLSTGKVSLSSSDLEIIRDGSEQQLVGVRFQTVAIPQGATIVDAYVQFTSDETDSEATDLIVQGQNSTNPSTFTSVTFDISNRPLTAAQVPWSPVAWTTNEQSSNIQATPNLAAIVQEIVSQAGWTSGNAMVFITSGTGKRVAESYNGAAAPVFHVSFSTAPPSNVAPVANDDDSAALPAYTTGIDQLLTVTDGIDDIVQRNDNVGFPAAQVSSADTFSVGGGIVEVSADGSFTYTPASGFIGVDSFSYTLSNSGGSSNATVYISVEEMLEQTALMIPVITGSDDAEQKVSSGSVSLSSSDLEMIRDGTSEQLVGVRFQGLNIPQGSTIAEAYIQYTVDESGSEATDLIVRGENNTNAETFTSFNSDISNRPQTSVQVEWAVPAWNTVKAAGPDQATPDLSSIVQEIVDQGGWDAGNAMVFITSGSGNRVAESFNGSAAPVLHLVYSEAVPTTEVPVATDVLIIDSNGDSLVVGDELTGSYTYFHAEDSVEGDSTYRWLREGAEIPDATGITYTTVPADGGKTLSFEVIPVSVGGIAPGTAAMSPDVTVFFELGGMGPAGGIVFYISDGVGVVGTSGMETSPENLGLALWGCEGASMLADGAAVGTGVQNTANILAGCNEAGIAAEVADLYELNGFTDWFLPSTGEALLMSAPAALVGNLNANFWTSTEKNNFVAWFLRVTSSDIASTTKNLAAQQVRPIRSFLAAGPNNAPVASNLIITDDNGGLIELGDTVTGAFTYMDAENNPQGTAIFSWLREGVVIVGANSSSYTTVIADQGRALTFQVTPVATIGTLQGSPVTSSSVTVEGETNDAPEALFVFIEDLLYDFSRELIGFYDYFDAEGDFEGVSLFQWFRDGLEIFGETNDVYVADDPLDINAAITFEVTPVASTGVLLGAPVTSDPFGSFNTAPVAIYVQIKDVYDDFDVTFIGDVLDADYVYDDAELDFEGVSTYQWFRDGVAIPGATTEFYTVVEADDDMELSFTITPVAETGILIGTPVLSNPVFVVP